MTPHRTGALVGVAAALLMTAPATAAEPAPDAVLDVENGALVLDAPPDPLVVPAEAEQVRLRWDTTAIEPGTVFGDVVRLRVSVEASGAPEQEPVVVPADAVGTVEVDVPPPGDHVLRVEAAAHALDGTPLTATRDYPVSVAARPATADEPVALPQARPVAPAAVAPAVVAPQPRAEAPAPRAEAAARQPSTVTGRVTLDRGHVDAVAVRLLPDGLRVQVKDGTVTGATTWREPADVEFRVTAAARTALPAQPVLSFLGSAGEQVFLLPQTQDADLLWTGWNTEELRPAEVSGPVTWALTAVDGPGAFGLFTTGSFGAPEVVFNSADGLPDALSVALGTHAHANWAFAGPGRYRLTFTVTATGANGAALTDAETLTFVVGDGGQAPPPPAAERQTGTANRLASTGPASVPAAIGLAVALLVTGAAALVLARRRPAKEIP
ncbi:surface-anchored protein [Saccharothrix saharensis]|uniref:Surface-anchored protein n=1 Tax=Saccharothrix saharensis TaxID=571190 RepID=A0A543J6M8_9PSEU|nr:choice-of-anchor M domain-containing protein [Saccharothrix saharensis]TQM78490.1 surface-anchored protein [Saccharothrix saharensis]